MSCIAAYYLLAVFMIGLSEQVPLDGENVRETTINELPFVVGLKLKGDQDSVCVGTLITCQSVLTAAHCLAGRKISRINVVAGSLDLRQGKRYEIKSWVSYDEWINATDDNSKPTKNDIAVITLKKKVKECTAAILTFSRKGLDNSKVRIAGWGKSTDRVSPMLLKTAVLQVITNDDCESKIESVLGKSFFVPEKLLCTVADPWVLGGCGDSGAPILNKQNQVVAIHRGVCPPGVTQYENIVNIHLHLLHYWQFINAVKI